MSPDLQTVTDVESELQSRSYDTGLPVGLLRAVYLRETGVNATVSSAMCRVDGFMVYALVRDTKFALDRDLAPRVTSRRT